MYVIHRMREICRQKTREISKGVGFSTDNFVGTEAQRQKCREFSRQNVVFCLEGQKKIHC